MSDNLRQRCYDLVNKWPEDDLENLMGFLMLDQSTRATAPYDWREIFTKSAMNSHRKTWIFSPDEPCPDCEGVDSVASMLCESQDEW